MKNRKILDYIRIIILFTFIYVVLNESLTAFTVTAGIIASLFAIFITNKILEIDYIEMFHIKGMLLLTYFWITLRDTAIGGIDVMKQILKNDVKSNLFVYKTELEDDFLIVLCANAITLSPGTIVVERQGKEMLILAAGVDKEQFQKDSNASIDGLFKKFDV